ncbi:MAG: CocE/NonD family hydrolase [Candidatus Binatia bacterium]|nr:CocE/NonD family hydrolase [Candidatus Binatia bacterium]
MSAPSLGELVEMAGAVWPILQNAITSGRLFRPQCHLTDPDPDILCEWDVRIPLADGTHVTANVFRSKSAAARGEKVPVVMCAHPYDNHLIPALGKTPLGGPPQQYRLIPQEDAPTFSTLTSWEAPDPNFWVRAGYAVVNMNMPGYANSGGRPTLFSASQTEAFGEAIDWVGTREWCTGKVGLSGVSYLAISQYAVAAGQTSRGVPSCLRAISPWEGISNLFQDMFREGGVAETGFPVFWWHTEVRPTINCSVEEFGASEGHLPQEVAEAHPFYDDYWRAKVPALEAIDLPMLICASFSDQGLHSRGSLRAFRKARSAQKWLYTHRRLKWDSYYSDEVLGLTRAFFDCFLKDDTENGFLDQAPVRLEIRSSRETIHEVREEQEWPIARTSYRRLYLASEELTEAAVPKESELIYDARTGQLRLRFAFTEDTELTGYMKLRLWVEARSDGTEPTPDDMILFAGVEKIDGHGQKVRFYGSVGNHADIMTRGLLAVSRRKLDRAQSTRWEPVLKNDQDEKLQAGQIVSVEIALNASSTFFAAGEGIELIVSPTEIVPSPPFRKDARTNRGVHVIYLGGRYDSHLLIPVVPATH